MQGVPYSRKYRKKNEKNKQSSRFCSTKKIRKTYTFFNSLPHRNKHKKTKRSSSARGELLLFVCLYFFENECLLAKPVLPVRLFTALYTHKLPYK